MECKGCGELFKYTDKRYTTKRYDTDKEVTEYRCHKCYQKYKESIRNRFSR